MLYLAVMLAVGQVDSPIKSDEIVTFFPTIGHIDGDTAVLPIHGWIYEPSSGFFRRQAVELFRQAMEIPEATGKFQERAAMFLVDNERGKRVPIRIGGQVFVMEESGANGHFTATVRLPLSVVKKHQLADGWLPFRAVTPAGDERVFAGQVQAAPEAGLSIISDIDDTIKISEVRKKKELLANTFIRDFQPAPGMAELYQKWRGQGAVFHYVSASPWQLYLPLAEFRDKHGFPAGSWHLKDFRWKDSSFWNLFAAPEKYKPGVIEPILKTFPKRQFICVGDSGEKDPEIYAALARKHPEQITRILIRDVTDEDALAERYQKAFEGVPKEKWQIFKEPKEVQLGK